MDRRTTCEMRRGKTQTTVTAPAAKEALAAVALVVVAVVVMVVKEQLRLVCPKIYDSSSSFSSSFYEQEEWSS